MAAKPSQSTILQFYSLDELLELVKLKSQEEVQQGLTQLQEALSGIVGGSAPPKAKVGRPAGRPPKKGKRGRPKGSTNVKTKAKKTSRTRAKNEKPLADFLLDILNKKPKGVPQIMEELDKKGYNTSSSNPKRLLYLELSKQSKKGVIQSKGRGKYIKK